MVNKLQSVYGKFWIVAGAVEDNYSMDEIMNLIEDWYEGPEEDEAREYLSEYMADRNGQGECPDWIEDPT